MFKDNKEFSDLWRVSFCQVASCE